MRFNRASVPSLTATGFNDQLINMLTTVMGNLVSLFDRGIGITDNLDAVVVSFTSNGSANTQDAIAHLLGRRPIGYIVTYLDKAAVVYDSGTAWTATQIFLKTSAASASVKLLVF